MDSRGTEAADSIDALKLGGLECSLAQAQRHHYHRWRVTVEACISSFATRLSSTYSRNARSSALFGPVLTAYLLQLHLDHSEQKVMEPGLSPASSTGVKSHPHV